jgi:hypothetical protein
MPSSTSSSEPATDRYARQTAADRPGVAQPVPVRPVPEQPWGRVFLGALLVAALLLAAWEAWWRAYAVTPGINNTFALWAIQRRRIDDGEGDATVLLGSSRLFFDVQLTTWEKLSGRRPIQLSFEGTTPLTALKDLAADPKFTGRLLIGIAPQVFFAGFNYRGGAVAYAHKESPSQRTGQWLSMRFIEPYLAFDDPDFALGTVLERQPWPPRPGGHWRTEVRKLSNHEADRNGYLWSKVDNDPSYRELARSIWREGFTPAIYGSAAERTEKIRQQIEETAKAVAILRARGVQVLFVRLPSSGEYLEFENRLFPRASTWDALLKASGAPGIYFEDYPELCGYDLPEWSHISHAEADRFTAALYGIAQRFWGAGATTAKASPVP